MGTLLLLSAVLVCGSNLMVVVRGEGTAKYQFSYTVKDQRSGQDFGQEEARTGDNTGGEYQVILHVLPHLWPS